MSISSDQLREQRALIDACLRYEIPFFWRGPGVLLIAVVGLQAVLEHVRSLGYEVLGLEAFEIESTTYHPRLDLIFDQAARPGIAAVSVVEQWPADVWVDVALRKP